MERRSRQRRCVICRRSGEKWELLRFIAQGDSLMWDEFQHSAGRGAYVHRSLACWSRMSQTGPFEHALRLGRSVLTADSVRAAQQAARARVPDVEGNEQIGAKGVSRAGARKVRL